MTYPYTQAEFDCFGWSPLSCATLSPAETYGLDYESAHDATPRLFAVTSGDGNDGVSHIFPDYYVRTADPFRLARAAIIDMMKPRWRQWAANECDVDGDYTFFSAVLYEGPNGETAFGDAWLIVEVFEAEGPDMSAPWYKPVYDSIEDAITPEAYALSAH